MLSSIPPIPGYYYFISFLTDFNCFYPCNCFCYCNILYSCFINTWFTGILVWSTIMLLFESNFISITFLFVLSVNKSFVLLLLTIDVVAVTYYYFPFCYSLRDTTIGCYLLPHCPIIIIVAKNNMIIILCLHFTTGLWWFLLNIFLNTIVILSI